MIGAADNAGDIAGVLLAGGLARRMGGGDKALLQLGGEHLLTRVIDRVRPQVGSLILNANGDPERFAGFGLPVVEDVIGGFAGPLAGILTGMTWVLENAPGVAWLASFATDAPFLPSDLVARLAAVVADDGTGGEADMACAMSLGRTHPVFALWPVRLADELKAAMETEDMRKIDLWTARYHIAHVDFGASFENGDVDPFFNVNRPENLDEAARLLAAGDAV